MQQFKVKHSLLHELKEFPQACHNMCILNLLQSASHFSLVLLAFTVPPYYKRLKIILTLFLKLPYSYFDFIYLKTFPIDFSEKVPRK